MTIPKDTCAEYKSWTEEVLDATSLPKELVSLVMEYKYPINMLFEENLLLYVDSNHPRLSDLYLELQKENHPLFVAYKQILESITEKRDNIDVAYDVFEDSMNSLGCFDLPCFRVDCMWSSTRCHCHHPISNQYLSYLVEEYY